MKIMKGLSIVITLIAVFLIQCIKSSAQEEKLIIKQKKISKHFNVKATDKLSIENRFGNVIINTWDKNEVTVDITENGKAKTDARARELLGNIDVKEES